LILVDTNIFIDYWKKPSDEYTKIFQENEIAICGVIQTELLRGCNSKDQFSKVLNALNCFEYLKFEVNDWIQIANFFITLRRSGLAIPFQDGIIAYLAKKHNCIIWTNDNHFKLIKTIVPEIKLL